MFRRYWITLAAIGFAVALAGIASTNIYYFKNRRNNDSATAGEHTYNQAFESCNSIEAMTSRLSCQTGVLQAYGEHQHAESDLRTQHDISTWALAMLWVSTLMLGVTGLGVWYVARTLQTSTEAVDAAKLANIAAADMATQAEVANELARENLNFTQTMMIQTERARMTADAVTLAPVFDPVTKQCSGWLVQHNWRNIGRTEGVDCKILWQRYRADTDFPLNKLPFSFHEFSSKTRFTWPPDSKQTIPIGPQNPIPLSHLVDVFEKRKRLFCWSGVAYDDIFDSEGPDGFRHHAWVCIEVLVFADPRSVSIHNKTQCVSTQWVDEFILADEHKPKHAV